jgi:hypothetical protein
MRIRHWLFLVVATVAALSQRTHAASVQASGTVEMILVHGTAYGPGDGTLILFRITPMPNLSGICSQTTHFGYSSARAVAKETRDNFLSTLMLAKSTGQTVFVEYDTTPNAYCDQNFPAPYRIGLL